MNSLVVSNQDTIFSVGKSSAGSSPIVLWGAKSGTWNYFVSNQSNASFNSVDMKDSVQAFAVGDSGIIYTNRDFLTSLKKRLNSYESVVFPNPVNSFLTIESQRMDNIEIIDMQGKIVYKSKVTDSRKEQISISNFDSGLYVLKIIHDDDSVQYKKIIKN